MKPLHQNIFKWIGFALFGFAFFGSILDSITNAVTIVSPSVTYISSPILISLWLLTELGLRLFGIKWKKGNRTIRRKTLGKEIHLALLGILILLWIPRIGDIPSRKPHIPLVNVTLVNSSDKDINVQRRGEFVLWLPTALYDGAPRVGGRYQLILADDKDYDDSPITVPAKSEKRVFVEILGEERFIDTLEKGDTDLSFMFRTNEGLNSSHNIPFSRNAITTRYMKWEVSRNDKP